MIESNTLTQLIIDGIQDLKGKDITVVDLSDIDGAAVNGFIICQGSSPTQVSSIADNVREHVRVEGGVKPYNYDGYKNSEWIVIDYGEILVHVFLPQIRSHYNLEDLWSDAKITQIENLD